MSKEKLSAYALYPVWFEQHGRELIVDCLYPFAEWYAAQVTEQLQRDKIGAFTLLRDGVEAFTSGDSNNRMTWISQASIFLTPKPEK